MRKSLMAWVAASMLGLASVGGAVHAQGVLTVEQADVLAAAAVAACSPGSDIAACEAALEAYSAYVAQLVAAGIIEEAEALTLFQELRDAIRAAGGGELVDALFEELFPDTEFAGDTDDVPETGVGVTGGGSGAAAPSPS